MLSAWYIFARNKNNKMNAAAAAIAADDDAAAAASDPSSKQKVGDARHVYPVVSHCDAPAVCPTLCEITG